MLVETMYRISLSRTFRDAQPGVIVGVGAVVRTMLCCGVEIRRRGNDWYVLCVLEQALCR